MLFIVRMVFLGSHVDLGRSRYGIQKSADGLSQTRTDPGQFSGSKNYNYNDYHKFLKIPNQT